MQSTTFPADPRRRVGIITAGAVAGVALILALLGLTAAPPVFAKTIAVKRSLPSDKQPPESRRGSARQALRYGYLVAHPKVYARQKARADRQAETRSALSSPASGVLAPSVIAGRSWQGINDVNSAPPDETSAVGTTRYIELVNSKFAIYNKTSNTPISTGSLASMMNGSSNANVFDVQIIWDPTTRRFYYAADDTVSAADNKIRFGFSTTASPSSAADWCKYHIDYGVPFPDFPKLGDSRDFAMIGVNVFANATTGGYLHSDLLAVSKPPAGTTCPAPSSFTAAQKHLSTNSFTPVPANEIDTNGTGWAVAVAGTTPATALRLFKVTRNSSGDPVIQGTPTNVSVPSYNIPPNAPQTGSVNKIDTADGRNTQAVAAIDPGHGGKFALWTQHTVRGGAGAEVRWYEINPPTHSVIQSGKATSGSLFEFNGAISPNRQVNGSTKSGGSSMVMNFNTSSSATKPGIRMVSKVGSGAQSGQVAIKGSPGQISGFDCDAKSNFCRWGDYAAATPDPSTANRIWNVSQFAVGSGSAASDSPPATSRTWNFIAKP